MDMDGFNHMILNSTTVGAFSEQNSDEPSADCGGAGGDGGRLFKPDYADSNDGVNIYEEHGDYYPRQEVALQGDEEQGGEEAQLGNIDGDNNAGLVMQQQVLEGFLKQHEASPRGCVGGSASYEYNVIKNLDGDPFFDDEEVDDTTGHTMMNMGMLVESSYPAIEERSEYGDEYSHPSSSYDSNDDFDGPMGDIAGCSDYVTRMPDLSGNDSFSEILRNSDEPTLNSKKFLRDILAEGDSSGIQPVLDMEMGSAFSTPFKAEDLQLDSQMDPASRSSSFRTIPSDVMLGDHADLQPPLPDGWTSSHRFGKPNGNIRNSSEESVDGVTATHDGQGKAIKNKNPGFSSLQNFFEHRARSGGTNDKTVAQVVRKGPTVTRAPAPAPPPKPKANDQMKKVIILLATKRGVKLADTIQPIPTAVDKEDEPFGDFRIGARLARRLKNDESWVKGQQLDSPDSGALATVGAGEGPYIKGKVTFRKNENHPNALFGQAAKVFGASKAAGPGSRAPGAMEKRGEVGNKPKAANSPTKAQGSPGVTQAEQQAIFNCHAELVPELDLIVVNLLKRCKNLASTEEDGVKRYNATNAVVKSVDGEYYKWKQQLNSKVLGANPSVDCKTALASKTTWTREQILKLANLMKNMYLQSVKMFYLAVPDRSFKVSLVKSATRLFELARLINDVVKKLASQEWFQGEGDYSAENIEHAFNRLTDWLDAEGQAVLKCLAKESEQKKPAVDDLKVFKGAYEAAMAADNPGKTKRAAAGGNNRASSARSVKTTKASSVPAPAIKQKGTNEKEGKVKRVSIVQPPRSPSGAGSSSPHDSDVAMVPAKSSMPDAGMTEEQQLTKTGPVRVLSTINEHSFDEADFLNAVAEAAEKYIKKLLDDGPSALQLSPIKE